MAALLKLPAIVIVVEGALKIAVPELEKSPVNVIVLVALVHVPAELVRPPVIDTLSMRVSVPIPE